MCRWWGRGRGQRGGKGRRLKVSFSVGSLEAGEQFAPGTKPKQDLVVMVELQKDKGERVGKRDKEGNRADLAFKLICIADSSFWKHFIALGIF